jgi:Flp pilus assembly pilin Flp
MEMESGATLSRQLGRIVSGFADDCSGATAVEYAIMTFIAIAVLVAVNHLGVSVAGMYQRVQDVFVN